MVLHLFDCSEYISAGPKSNSISRLVDDSGPFRVDRMPSGGVAFLLNTIVEFADTNADLVYCFDRPPVKKRELHERVFPSHGGYKGQRPKKDESIIYQRQMAEELLNMMGAQTVAVEEYESDDIIASLVKYYKDSYEKIYIHANDSDFYYLVDSTVEVLPMGTTGKHITRRYWESTVLKDEWIPYGLLTLHKALKGETGDNIPRLPADKADLIRRVLGPIREDKDYSMFADMEYLRAWVDAVVKGDRTTMAIFDLLIPLEVPYRDIELCEYQIDMDAFWYCASKVGCKYARGLQPLEIQKYKDVFDKYLDLYSRR